MRIDDRVREAHLRHFCPGGLGVPVVSGEAIGMPADAPGGAQDDGGDGDDRRFRADGDCGRCGQPLARAQNMRRTADGIAVHENCPR
jgi:hypothetical protein